MANKDSHLLIIALFALLMGGGSSGALAQTGDAQDHNRVDALPNSHDVDRFDDSIRRWMKSQAVYWRRQQYADIASLQGTKEFYRKSHLINAQLYIQYAKVALGINDNGKQALDDLDHAMSLIKEGEKGAGKSETTQINQLTSEIDRIKGNIKQASSPSVQAQKEKKDLDGVFMALRHIVEKG